MPATDQPLETLRREIDAIDEAMHDLLMRRAELGAQVREAKGGAEAQMFRPGREAQIIRRLVRRHHGPLPPAFVALLWREIIAAMIRLQGPFRIAVYAAPGGGDLLRLVHEHFGALTPVLSVGAPGQVLAALIDGHVKLGVLPLPEDPTADGWWRHLGPERPQPPRILARLPFARGLGGDEALVVGCQPFEPTGEDRGYLSIETLGEISRTRLAGALEAAGMKALSFASLDGAAEPAGLPQQQLVEVEPYRTEDDPSFAVVKEKLGEDLVGLRMLGGYAVPLTVSSDGELRG